MRIVSSDHHNLAIDEVIEAGKVKEVEYRMNRKRYGAFESVVRGARERKEVAVHEVAVEELTTVPGTQGDVLKVIQDFPGVARAPFGLGLLIVRGSAPQDTVVYMDGVQIPLLFHFLALTAVINSDVISGLDFFPGNFSPYYGNAMGGAVEIHTRDPKHEWHGAGHVDLYDGAAMVEGPVGDGSFFASVRRSWVDQVLKAVVPHGLTVAPVFYDYQVKYVHSLWGGQGSLFAFGSSDALDILDCNTARVISFDSEIQFHRLAASWKRGFSHHWRNDVVLSLGYDETNNEAVNAIEADATTWSANLRDTLTYQPSDRLTVQMGIDSSLRHFSYDLLLPPFEQAGAAFSNGGLAANPPQNAIGQRQLRAAWAVRLCRRGAGTAAAGAAGAAPRRQLAHHERELVLARSAPLGVLHGRPQDRAQGCASASTPRRRSRRSCPHTQFGNPDLTYQRSFQYSVGVDQKLPFDVNLGVTLYDKYLYQLVTPTDAINPMTGQQLNLSNLGKGRSYGMEVLLRRQIMRGFYGWVAYTLSRTTRLDDPSLMTGGYHLYDFDQTHILTVIASYQTEHNWTFGTRLRYTSGDPYTPFVNGIFNANNASYTCIPGNPDTARAAGFFQADVRIDRRFVYDKWSFTPYLDIQNVTNRANPEAQFPNYNCQGYATLTGLPIFPTLGLRAEF